MPRGCGSKAWARAGRAAVVVVLVGAGIARAALLTSSQPYLAAFPQSWSEFGASVAVTGEAIVVSAPREDDAGAVYVFDGTTGEQRLRIAGERAQRLGSSLALLGDDIIAGAPGEPVGATPGIGTVTVFDGTTGLPRLVLPNPRLIPRHFGTTVIAVGGDILVGAPGVYVHPGTSTGGAAYMFDGTTGVLLRTFESPMITPDDHFGSALAVLGADVVVGAPDDDATGRDAGAVFVFDAVSGSLVRILHSPAPRRGGRFGAALATDGADLLVGAPGDAVGGAAYLFDARDGHLGTVLLPPEARGDILFASSLAFVGPRVVVGAPGSAVGDTGAAYVFERDTGGMVQKLVSPDSHRGSGFGSALGTASPSDVLVGAPIGTAAVDGDGIVWRFGDRCGTCGPCESCEPSIGCGRVVGCGAEIWCLGDSITAIYAPRLAELEPTWRVRNLGQPRETADSGLRRLRILLDQTESLPDIVVVLYGTNDIGTVNRLGGRPDAGAWLAADRISQIVALLRGRGIQPLVALPIGVPHGMAVPDGWDPSTTTQLAAGFTALRARLLPMRPVVDFRLRRAGLYADLVHPNANGGFLLAQRARRAVGRLLARRGAVPP